MDKDNLGIQHILTSMTTEKLKSVQGEAQQEVMTALCLMVLGLLLASVGLVGVLLRLGRLAGCNILFAGRPVISFLLNRKRIKKILLAQ